MVVLDTNIIIDHLRQKGSQDSLLMKVVKNYPEQVLAISVISIQELYEGKSTLDKQKVQFLINTLKPLEILAYTEDVAKLAGILARDITRPIELADAAIAATTILNQATLLTLNKKDFRDIKELKLLE